MRRLILILICALGMVPMHINAQTSDEKAPIDALAQKVDSLEHELEYLNLSFEFESFYNRIYRLNNDVRIRIIDVHFFTDHKYFKKKYWELCIEDYKGYMRNMETLKAALEWKQLRFGLYKIIFSEAETENLSLILKMAENMYLQAENSLNSYKRAIDYYRDEL